VELERPDCPVCGPAPPHAVWLDEGRGTRYVRCAVCRTVFASPRLPAEARRATLEAEFSAGEPAATNAKTRAAALIQEAAIVRRYASGGRVLDVGCDLGDFLGCFPGAGWSRSGVELSPSAARHAAEAHAADVHVGDLRSAKFPSGFFDVVAMLDVVQYLDDPREDLREVRRILRPGGLVALETAGQAYLLWRNRGLVCRLVDRRWSRMRSDSHYLQWLHPSAVLRLLEDAQLTPLRRYVIESPRSAAAWRNAASTIHGAAARLLTGLSARAWSLAPKYLVIARATGPA
jgi:SAM-dependent methyltransferase